MHVGTKERIKIGTVFFSTAANWNSSDQKGCCVSTDYTRAPDTHAPEGSGRSFLLAKCIPVAPGRTHFTKHNTFLLCNTTILF